MYARQLYSEICVLEYESDRECKSIEQFLSNAKTETTTKIYHESCKLHPSISISIEMQTQIVTETMCNVQQTWTHQTANNSHSITFPPINFPANIARQPRFDFSNERATPNKRMNRVYIELKKKKKKLERAYRKMNFAPKIGSSRENGIEKANSYL